MGKKRRLTDALMAVVGHIMSDPKIVSHCCFCGSGAIVRQSDETINCTFCDRSFLVMEQPKFSAAPGDPNAVPPAGGLPSAEQPDPGVDPTAPDAPGEPPVQHSPVNPQTDPDALASAPPFKLGSARIERFAVRRGPRDAPQPAGGAVEDGGLEHQPLSPSPGRPAVLLAELQAPVRLLQG